MPPLDFPDNPAADQIFATPKIDFIWKTGPGRWRRQVPVSQTVSSIVPNSGQVNTAIAVSVFGSGFTANSKIWALGQQLATTFTSATELRATLPAHPTVETIEVFVVDGSWTSDPLNFAYAAPPPMTLTAIDPRYGATGAAAFTVKYTGTNFTPDCTAYEDGWFMPTSFVSATELHATHTPPGGPGVKQCNVRRGTEQTASFPLEYLVSGNNPDISTITPYSVSYVSSDILVVDVVGVGGGSANHYSPDAVVVMGGRDMPTTFQAVGLLRFDVRGSDWSVGTYPVVVRQAGGVSDPPFDFFVV
jgi:hypothetical protein